MKLEIEVPDDRIRETVQREVQGVYFGALARRAVKEATKGAAGRMAELALSIWDRVLAEEVEKAARKAARKMIRERADLFVPPTEEGR